MLYNNITNKYILQLLQCVPTKPSRQPPVHSPLTWSHKSLIKQCSLQRLMQPNPNCPAGHSSKDNQFVTLAVFLDSAIVSEFKLVISLNDQVNVVWLFLQNYL